MHESGIVDRSCTRDPLSLSGSICLFISPSVCLSLCLADRLRAKGSLLWPAAILPRPLSILAHSFTLVLTSSPLCLPALLPSPPVVCARRPTGGYMPNVTHSLTHARTRARALSLTHSLFLTRTDRRVLTQRYTHTYTLSLLYKRTLPHTPDNQLALTYPTSHAHTHTHTLSFMQTHARARALSLTTTNRRFPTVTQRQLLAAKAASTRASAP